MFQPGLPGDKVQAIESLGFGLIDKVFLEFDTVFWDPANPGIQLVEPDSDTPANLATDWAAGIASFDVAVGREKTLCGWLVGETARHAETLTEEQVTRRRRRKRREGKGEKEKEKKRRKRREGEAKVR
jgi:hypothetical protein